MTATGTTIMAPEAITITAITTIMTARTNRDPFAAVA